MSDNDDDLFADSTMSFGEHLEVLRVHLIKALIGVLIGTIVGLIFGGQIIGEIKRPLVKTLRKYATKEQAEAVEGAYKETSWGWFRRQLGLTYFDEMPEVEGTVDPIDGDDAGRVIPAPTDTLDVDLSVYGLLEKLHELSPDKFEMPAEELRTETVEMTIRAPEFAIWRNTALNSTKPVVLTVQEGFLTYLKVSFISGFVLASWWVFLQAWQFVAAGLYPHEKKYVYKFGPMSFGLFISGVLFAFYVVLPFALDFFIGFNQRLGFEANIRINEWISFAVFLPVLFGISFQMPLVMLFLERIGVFEVKDYREKRNVALFVIAIVSAVLTPQDPITMMLMMVPLVFLYELGIWLCKLSGPVNPFEGDTPAAA